MATLTLQTISEAGSVVSYAAAAGGGDVVDNRFGRTFLNIKNGGGGSVTVTITAQSTNADNPTYGDLTKSDASIAIAAGAESFIGPFPKKPFNNSSNQIAITYSGVTSLTIAAITTG